MRDAVDVHGLTQEALETCISRLSEVFAGEASRLGENLLDFLLRHLRLDLAVLRLVTPGNDLARDIIAAAGGLSNEQIDALLLSPAGGAADHGMPSDGISTAVFSLGRHGMLLAGSKRQDFPCASERLLLAAAANPAAFDAAALNLENVGLRETLSSVETESRYLQQTLDMIPALAWVSTIQSKPAFFNQYYLDYVGRTALQMWDDGWSLNLNPDDLPSYLADWAAIMASNKPGDLHARLRSSDGEYRWFLFRCNPLLDEAGNTIRWFGVNTDVEDRRRAEEMLRNTQAELARVTRAMTMGQLTASIAHELRQPLAGIITNAGACLRMLAADPPNIKGAVETAHRTIRDGNRASEVIARLRALFSKKSTSTEPVDLNSASQEVIALARTELRKRSVSLRSRFAKNLPLAIADRIQIQQVILNLVLNAAESMAEIDSRAREITLSTGPDGPDRVQLTVKDMGVGFDVAETQKLFAPFFTTKPSGMGIGLTVSRTIVEQHHGVIWARPNDGPGATFGFSIPIDPAAAPVAQ